MQTKTLNTIVLSLAASQIVFILSILFFAYSFINPFVLFLAIISFLVSLGDLFLLIRLSLAQNQKPTESESKLEERLEQMISKGDGSQTNPFRLKPYTHIGSFLGLLYVQNTILKANKPITYYIDFNLHTISIDIKNR